MFIISRPNDSSPSISPFPSPAHLYLLAAGIVVGILLGPGVLGRAAPQTHRQWFGGVEPGVVEAELQSFRDHTTQSLKAMENTGVTQVAVDEYLNQRHTKQAELEARLRRQIKAEGLIKAVPLSTAVLLALLAVMVLEPLLAPDPGQSGQAVVTPALGRLITVRYALAAVWLALILAQPTVLWSLPLLFTGVLLAVALILGLSPLSRKRSNS